MIISEDIVKFHTKNRVKPLKSVLEAKYYTRLENDVSNDKYIELIENNYKGNTEYIRYWHGSILIIKPLLMIFTLEQIYIFFAIILVTLAIILFIQLIIKKYYSIVVSLISGLIMVAVWYVPFTFEYVWTFILMFITSIMKSLLWLQQTVFQHLT